MDRTRFIKASLIPRKVETSLEEQTFRKRSEIETKLFNPFFFIREKSRNRIDEKTREK